MFLNPVMCIPSDEKIKSSQMYKFMKKINAQYNLNLVKFADLHSWSVKNKSDFWSSVWDFFEIIGSKGTEPYIEPINKMLGSEFFLMAN